MQTKDSVKQYQSKREKNFPLQLPFSSVKKITPLHLLPMQRNYFLL